MTNLCVLTSNIPNFPCAGFEILINALVIDAIDFVLTAARGMHFSNSLEPIGSALEHTGRCFYCRLACLLLGRLRVFQHQQRDIHHQTHF
jgi:hypothetical protein